MIDAIALFSAAHWLDFITSLIKLSVTLFFFFFCRTFKQKFLTDASENPRCSPYRVLGSLSLCPPLFHSLHYVPPREKECLWLIYFYLLLAYLPCYSVNQPSVKYLETLAKILDFPANSRYLLKPLIRSCLFLLDTNLLKFLIGILVRVLSRVQENK